MTKEDLSHVVMVKTGFSKKQSYHYVETLFQLVKDTLAIGEIVKISGFGVFEVKERASRKVRIPDAGRTVEIPRKKVVKFRPSRHLKTLLNESEAFQNREFVQFPVASNE